MKHKRIEQLIQKSLDFEISRDEKRILHDHLETCSECRRFYETMMQLHASLGMLSEHVPSRSFNTRVIQKLGTMKSFAWKKYALILAGAWTACLAGLFLIPYDTLVREILTSSPAIVRLGQDTIIIVETISHVLAPLTRIPINPFYPVLGILISIVMFITLGKTVHKEEPCKA